MKIRYFVVGARGQLRKIRQRAVRDLWEGRCPAHTLGSSAGHELRLASVLCDERLLPRKVYLLRLPLDGGVFSDASYFVLRAFTRSDCITARELIAHHTEGWPADFFRQLAVALDVPVRALGVPFGMGGPLFVATALRVTPRQALRYLR